jgi:lipoprotein-anchoring transpeptidase ErfK/SrfK
MLSSDMEELKFPHRRPWLLLVVLLIGAGVLLIRSRSGTGGRASAPESVRPEAADKTAKRPATPAVTNAPSQGDGLLAAAQASEARGALVEARRAYLDLLKQPASPTVRAEAENRLGRIDIELINSPAPMPEKTNYVIRKNDRLETIAKRHGTTALLIQKSNLIAKPTQIKIGDMLRVFTGKFMLTVSKSRNDMVVYMNDEFFKRYRVGTGRFGKTPVGTFAICDKIVNPPWWRQDGKEVPFGDPENVLGTRWMALRATGSTPDVKGYGIHGTWDESSVGQAVTQGCVRMKNADVEELFDLLPLDTVVMISE